MKILIAAASLAALVLAVDSASAATKHRTGGAVAAPKQPIPYSQLDSYLKASPRQRASKDWWSGAETGAQANTAATTPALPNDTPAASETTPSNSMAPNSSTAAPNTQSPPDATSATPPGAEASPPDAGKGEMSNPAVDKPH